MQWFRVRQVLAARGYWEENDGNGSDLGGSGSNDDNAKPEDKKSESKKSDDGKPTEAEAKLLKEVMARKGELKDANAKVAELSERLKAFDGIDPEQIKALLTEKQNAERAQLEAKGDFDRVKTLMAEQHQTEVAALKNQLAELQSKLGDKDGAIHGLTIGNAFASSNYIATELTLPASKAKTLYGDHFEFKDGAIVGYDKPKGAADRTLLVNASGNPVSFDEALAKIVSSDPDGDAIIRSKIKPGAGSGGNASSLKTTPPKETLMSGREKIAAGLKSRK